jgi:hypothetical protein
MTELYLECLLQAMRDISEENSQSRGQQGYKQPAFSIFPYIRMSPKKLDNVLPINPVFYIEEHKELSDVIF